MIQNGAVSNNSLRSYMCVCYDVVQDCLLVVLSSKTIPTPIFTRQPLPSAESLVTLDSKQRDLYLKIMETVNSILKIDKFITNAFDLTLMFSVRDNCVTEEETELLRTNLLQDVVFFVKDATLYGRISLK